MVECYLRAFDVFKCSVGLPLGYGAGESEVGCVSYLGGVLRAYRVHFSSDGVDGVHKLTHILAYVLAAHAAFVYAVEVGVEWEIYLFVVEVLAPEGHITRRACPHGVVAHILEHFAAVEVQEEACLVFGEVESARIGQYHAGIVIAARQVVENHTVKHSCFGVLAFGVQVHIRYLVVERARRYFHLR